MSTLSYYEPRLLGGVLAAADLSALKGYGVKFDGSGKIVACTAAGESALGILQNKPGTDNACEIATVGGGAFGIAGAAVAQGAYVAVTAAGKLITATTGQYVVGIAMSAALADDDEISIDCRNFQLN